MSFESVLHDVSPADLERVISQAVSDLTGTPTSCHVKRLDLGSFVGSDAIELTISRQCETATFDVGERRSRQ